MSENMLRINIEILNTNSEILSSHALEDYYFSKPTTAAEVGLPLKSQQDIMAEIQQNVIDGQAAFLK